MKAIIFLAVLLIFGCTKSEPNLELVAIQHIGKGVINGDACKTLYREDGRDVTTPVNFKITPYEAVSLVKEKLGYSCGHKFGSQVLADKEHYHIVRAGVTQDAIIVNGEDGSIVSKGFMARSE